ncbi:MAG: hypothetical protein ABIK09_13600 [Pseudomonadota bacterium]
MLSRALPALVLITTLVACGDNSTRTPEDTAPADTAPEIDVGPACAYETRHLIPGPCEEGWDPDLDLKARRYDRTWTLFNASAFGVNTDVGIAAANTEDRALVNTFIQEMDGWEAEFEAFAGKKPTDVITGFNKVAGLYGGVGIVADAYRYGVLRDQGYPVADVDQARGQLLRALETLHLATAITGVEGVICRGLAMKEWGYATTTPLFDDDGVPLPYEKNNGTWREDNSPDGAYPNVIWEDSVSRDMLIGWAAAFGAAWEVIRNDETVPGEVKETLQADATALGKALMVVGESGYDLEVPDADGRITLHGWLNEHNLDGAIYSDLLENGFHAIMALGIVGSYAYAAEDPELTAWFEEELVKARELPRITKEHVNELTDFGYGSNFSNYNMAFTGYWMAMRYVQDPDSRQILREGLKNSLYDRPGEDFQPADHGYSLYDFTFVTGWADGSAFAPMASEPLSVALGSGMDTLRLFAEPPYWDHEVINCPAFEACTCADDQCTCPPEATAEPCVASDGETLLTPLGCKGWKCSVVVDAAVPWDLQRPSNYHWRSAPHDANGGGDGSGLLPGVDFRFAYWIGRWAQR